MSWAEFPLGLRLEPVARRSPESLVVLLRGMGASAAALAPIAARWAPAVPATAFVALHALDRIHGPCGIVRELTREADPPSGMVRLLEPMLEAQLDHYRLDASHLVLVGFDHGGTLALQIALHEGWGCAGVLAFAAKPIPPLPRFLRIGCKVRLIDTVPPEPVTRNRLRDTVALLTARGIDTRGVLLSGSPFSDEAIRHGGAYLVELVATAQCGNHSLNRESSHAQ